MGKDHVYAEQLPKHSPEHEIRQTRFSDFVFGAAFGHALAIHVTFFFLPSHHQHRCEGRLNLSTSVRGQ